MFEVGQMKSRARNYNMKVTEFIVIIDSIKNSHIHLFLVHYKVLVLAILNLT